MRLVEFIVAGRPFAKGRVRFASRTGHAYTPERTVRYEGEVAAAAAAAMNGRPPVPGPVAVRLDVRLPIAVSWSLKKQLAADLGHLKPTGRPDLDNYVKILDSCNHILWNDDSQIVEFTAFKRYSSFPGITVTVNLLTESGSPI